MLQSRRDGMVSHSAPCPFMLVFDMMKWEISDRTNIVCLVTAATPIPLSFQLTALRTGSNESVHISFIHLHSETRGDCFSVILFPFSTLSLAASLHSLRVIPSSAVQGNPEESLQVDKIKHPNTDSCKVVGYLFSLNVFHQTAGMLCSYRLAQTQMIQLQGE